MPLLDRTGWTATASSYYDAATTPDKALDGIDRVNETYWLSDVGFPHWIEVDMQAEKTINFVKVIGAYTRFKTPILWSQDLPYYVSIQVYVGGLWLTPMFAVWPPGPSDRTHYIYFPYVTTRYFRFNALYGGSYNRAAFAEIYAGLLGNGDDCKYYYHARPTQFGTMYTEKQGYGGETIGVIDYNERGGGNGYVCPPLPTPNDLDTEQKVAQRIRVWETGPLNWYPEMLAWNYTLPANYPSIPGLESISVVVEGTFALASNTPPMMLDLELSPNFGSNQGFFDFTLPWYINGEERWIPRIHTFWRPPDDPTASVNLESIPDLVMHHWIWHSLKGKSPEGAEAVDVSHFGTLLGGEVATDAYLLIVWKQKFEAPAAITNNYTR